MNSSRINPINPSKLTMRFSCFSLLFVALATRCLAAAPGIPSADSLTDIGPRQATLRPMSRITHKALTECSGLAFVGGAFWTHGDYGSPSVLFRSTALDFSNAETFEIPGVKNFDWEDLAVLDGDLLVCDIGDNFRTREKESGESVKVYRVRYVAASEGKPARVDLIATYPIRYPDGPHDAEAACVIDGKLHIVVKNSDEKDDHRLPLRSTP